jgi:glutathione S-transferase
MSQPRYKLYYWPLPFRGCFVSYLFAYRDVPLLLETDFQEIDRLRTLAPKEQSVPFTGPPVLCDLESGQCISQMPAIVTYVAPELGLLPANDFERAMALKVLMDCNDVLMEICCYNGSMMWEREQWLEFRSTRLPRWMCMFEEALARGTIGGANASFADIGVYALFGNMIRCLPELEAELLQFAPGIHALCQRLGSEPSLARYVAEQERQSGKLYCGGQIEESIRAMLAQDSMA